MPDTKTPTELTSQYTAQVVGDLERNAKEQERVGLEIDALQEQLNALQHDHAVLTNLHQALGATGALVEAEPAPKPASSVPRQKAPGKSAAGKRTRTKKADAVKETAARTSAAKKPAAEATSTQPTLIDLIRRYLTEQREPRSAAEVSTALGQTHPDRRIQTNVVRTTLENLVAKSHAHRAKQGSSVFYTAVDAQEPTAPAPSADRPTEPKAVADSN
ncbi:hypothetical protein [Streptomyces rhizosphaerihabitans]|uniref:hypothetical protein n=1 Tax=Streptomyces rhizosphaerihabitans TaxID=1266770 RepID=UPI0021BF9899|nr:hypothetical protein [Streptomyces rhizosphaerihabitans]MCT9007721.1 hypothetical protein [Streptomyces rhizosphaerihabitans]